MTEKNVASNAWQHRLSKGDFFTIDHHFKNPSWTQSTVQTFEQLDCKPELVEILQKANIHNPTSTQSRVIPELRTGQHMIVAAETGGGKTLAYLVPLIESLIRWKSSNRLIKIENAPFAIILTPTRELVAQIEVREREEMKWFFFFE
jgi:superfamily II DNA/RNA helicase